MPVFVWEGRNRNGAVRKGEYEAVDETTAIAHLRGQQLMGIKVKPKGFSLDLLDVTLAPR